MKLAKAGAAWIGKQLIREPLKQSDTKCSPLYWLACSQSCFSDTASRVWDYETERKTFQLKTPDYYNFARDVIDTWAEKEKV